MSVVIAEHNWLEAANTQIADDLATKGWSVQPGYLSLSQGSDLKSRLGALIEADALSRAGVGREDQHQLREDIRRDATFWLTQDNDIDRSYLDLMEQLRLTLNRSLYLGVFEYEAHYAAYPSGGFYKKHVDALKGAKNRIVSTVCYLNEGWKAEYGGLLNIYDQTDETLLLESVVPHSHTLAVFLSEDIPHEVTPANRERHSIAGWFRCNSSSSDKADPFK